MAQKIAPDGAPIKPLALYHNPTRNGCSSRFHQEDVIKTNPGLRADSKIPRRNRTAAREPKDVHAPVTVKVVPILDC